MSVTKEIILGDLPPFSNKHILIEKNQEIHDIIKEVLNAHNYFKGDYDLIFDYFDKGSVPDICKKLFDFCKNNINYVVESEDRQTTKSPAAVLSISQGDCKHYAGFIGGVLSSINRNTDKKINWVYRFANYSFFSNSMEHVFIVVKYEGKEIWIDPVLCCFNSRQTLPVNYVDKKISDMSLTRISGMGLISPTDKINQVINFDSNYLQSNAQTTDVNLPQSAIQPDDYYANTIDPTLEDNIKELLYYGIIDSDMNIHNDIFVKVTENLSETDANLLGKAFGNFLDSAQNINAIGGNIFSSIWGTVKQVSMAIPRGAYLALVSLNVFNLAGHLNKVITNIDGSTDQAGIDSLQGVWHKKLSGDTNLLLRAIRNGAHKKAILGIQNTIGVAPVAAAWAVTASVIIVAMTPIIKSVLQKKNQFDSMAASQLAMQPMPPGGTSGTSNLIVPILIGGAALFFITKKKK